MAMEDQLAMLVHRVEKVSAIDTILARVRGMGEVRASITHTPVYWERPEQGYKTPSYGQWKRWLESRIGLLPIVSAIDGARVLCIACGIPVALSTGDKTMRGVRGSKVLEDGKLSHVVVGAIVKFKDEVHTWENGFVVDTEEVDKFIVVNHKALACVSCQLHFAKVKHQVARENEANATAHRTKYAEYMSRVRELIAQSPDMDIAQQKALLRFTGDAPKVRTPFIMVDVKDIREEQTVAYWHRSAHVSA